MIKHVILDTDIGGDPDDVLALLFGLYSPEIQIDLIVTSDEHKGHRAEFARQILMKLGKVVPVIKGSDLGNNRCCVICDLVEVDVSTSNYLPAVRQVIQNNLKTYYICIGPQTNLATFIEFAPELVSKLEVVIMGGAINYRKVDHNIRYDVKSARKVFASDINMRWVLRNTTFNPALKINKRHPIYKRLKESVLTAKEMLIKNFQNYFNKLHSSTIMHDPLTLSYVINPKFITFEEKRIEMDKGGGFQFSERGRLLTVSTAASYQKFMDFFNRRLPF